MPMNAGNGGGGTCEAWGARHRGGYYVVERWGCEDLACGVEGLCNIHWLEKKQKK